MASDDSIRAHDAHTAVEPAGGGRIPGTKQLAFESRSLDQPQIPVLIAAPHGGRCYPESLIARMRDAEYAKLRLEDRLIDELAAAVAQETGAPLIMAHAPRAMLDLNRADDDLDWSMVADGPVGVAGHSRANRRARSGLGLIPRRLHGLGEIWRQRHSQAEVDERIAHIHEPYHAEITQSLSTIRRRWGAALLLDLHSMPPLKKRHPDEQPAEFVIGDRFGASGDGMLSATALRYFASHDRRAAHNRPYAGGYVLDRHGRPALGIHAMQLEVCRSLYLDARFEKTSARMPMLVRLLAGLVRELAGEINTIGRTDLPQAAE